MINTQGVIGQCSQALGLKKLDELYKKVTPEIPLGRIPALGMKVLTEVLGPF